MEYLHKVQYYETDKMGVVHHSNYIRWFEEARTDFMEKAGIPYDKLEAEGIISPVTDVSCKYISPARFGENVRIETALTELGNVRFTFEYKVLDEKGAVKRAEGFSRHCFTGQGSKVISLKRQRPELFAALQAAADRTLG